MRLEILPGPDVQPAGAGELACPCGWGGRQYESDGAHAYRHLEWGRGVCIPAALDWSEGQIAAVWTDSPARWRWLAYRLAHLAQRAGGYDFPSFPMPSRRGRGLADAERTRALLYRVGELAAGYLVVADAPTFGRWDLTAREVPRGPDRPVRPTVMLAWTAFHWRRRGIASALVRAAAEHAGVPVDGLGWCTPFSQEGMALARGFAGPDGGVWLV